MCVIILVNKYISRVRAFFFSLKALYTCVRVWFALSLFHIWKASMWHVLVTNKTVVSFVTLLL